MALSDKTVHTTLPVQDLARAKAFYAEGLGLTPHFESDAAVMYEMGDGTGFNLFPTAGAPSGTHTQMGITVTDVVAEVAELKERGVVFEEYDTPGFTTVNSVVDMGGIMSAFFKDSEGNMLALVQFN